MKNQFYESALLNNYTFDYYYNRLVNLALSRFDWKGLPETVDVRFLEQSLLFSGQAIFVNDVVVGIHGLKMLPKGPFDVYGRPINRNAYGYNGVNIHCTPEDSVLVYNDMMRKPCWSYLKMFAHRLYNYDRICDVNVNAQKTPVLILCNENERLTAQNVYMKYDGNQPVIMGNKNFNPEMLRVLKTDAPFVADKINELKNRVWNEALTYLGIYNVELKAANVTEIEVRRAQGGTIASRFSPLAMRMAACDELNQKWGLDASCSYRDPNDFEDPLTLQGGMNEYVHNRSQMDYSADDRDGTGESGRIITAGMA